MPLADFGRLFGYGGVFDTFFKNELEPLVDTSRTPWTWRADASGVSVGPSLAMLRQFEAAQRIREMFFRPGGQEPEVRFRLTPTDLDAAATQVPARDRRSERRVPAWSRAKLAGDVAGPESGSGRGDVRGARRRPAEHRRSRDRGPGSGSWTRRATERETDVRYVLTFAKDGHEARVQSRGREHPESVREGRPAAVPLRSVDDRQSAAAAGMSMANDRQSNASHVASQLPSTATARCGYEDCVDVGFYGKLPSHGDFLRRRVSDAFVGVWDPLAAGLHGGKPVGARRALARRLPHEPGVAVRLRGRASAVPRRSSG